jgi:hypothetical protein
MGARHGSTTRVSSTLRCAAIAAGLALLPASALAQETVYLECEKSWTEPAGRFSQVSVHRFSIVGNEIVQASRWVESERRWNSNTFRCGAGRPRFASGRCSVEPGAYVLALFLTGFEHQARVDRRTGAWSESLVVDGDETTYSGTCRRTENPELTPAPEPVL